MAVIFMDGCDTYTAVADVYARYGGSSGGGVSTTGGRFGGGCISTNSSGSANQAGPVSIPHTGANAIICGCAFYQGGGNNTPIICLWNSTPGTAACELALQWDASVNVLKLWRGTITSGTLIATTTQSFTTTVWHHIEMKSVIADSGGSCEVRVDGVTVINFSGDTRATTTGTAGVDKVYFCTYANGASTGALDDMYILDSSGSVANNFIGDCRINTLTPSSDSAVQFTRSTGASNYLCVDEQRQNSDTDYVESATVGHIDKYGYQDLAANVSTVYGVQALTWARKTDANTRTMRNKLYSGAATSDGSTYALTTTYAPYAQVATLDPNTTAAWTPTTVNAALAGFEVVS